MVFPELLEIAPVDDFVRGRVGEEGIVFCEAGKGFVDCGCGGVYEVKGFFGGLGLGCCGHGIIGR